MITVKQSSFGGYDVLCPINGPVLLRLTPVMKKPIPVKAIQMCEPFQVETLEGTMSGKAGDWLMEGVSGEMYPCDAEIFDKTYDILPDAGQNL